MKRLVAAFLLAGLSLWAPAWGQTWYYNVGDDVAQITPATINFNPASQDMLCAALLEPAGGGQVSLDNINMPANCPNQPPVVVWGIDPDTGDTVYAALIQFKFWGEKQYDDSFYGVDRLIRVLEDYYGLNINAGGDLDKVDAQFLPPLITPPVSSPPNVANGWYTWRGRQSVSVGRPKVTDKENHWFINNTCWDLYKDNCWSAVLTWALPIRLVVHGGELGSYQIKVSPDDFSKKTAATLSVSGGELAQPRVLPAPR